MRKIILFMVMSLDGFVGGPKGELDWEIRDDEIGRYMMGDLLPTIDTMILGRNLFEGFEQAWPAIATDPKSPADLVAFAHWIEDSPKIVFSKNTDKIGWKNSRLIRVKHDDEIVKAVAQLKQEPGKDIVLFGGARIARTFVKLGLVDEYRFKVQPIALGTGLPLFSDLKERRTLKLVKSKVFDSGVLGLCYVPV